MKSVIIRWMVLLVTLANIIFNGTYTKLTGLPPINIISDKYFNLFTPAGYAFAIWGIIYLSFIVYAFHQLLPRQIKNAGYDQLARPFIFINLLGSLWIVFFTAEQITFSILIMIATLIIGIIAFMKAKKAIEKGQIKANWILIPFSLFVGWISVATIANFSAWFVSMGWNGGDFGAQNWTILLVVIAGLLGIIFTFRQRNSIYPLVIAWAALAIYFARSNDFIAIGFTALVVAAIMVLASVANLFLSINKR